MERLHLQPTESELKRDTLRVGYRQFFENWVLDIPFQWAVTIHYPHPIDPRKFESKINSWLRKIKTRYFKPTLGAVGFIVERQGHVHAHLFLYGKNLNGGGFDPNGNSLFEEAISDMQKAQNIWIEHNGSWQEPSYACPSAPNFISLPKERGIDISPIYDLIGSAQYFALEKNSHTWRDQPSEIFFFYPDFLKKTAKQITNRTALSAQR